MVALGADHGGFELKEKIKLYLTAKGISFIDYGTFTPDSVDYPDMAKAPCRAVVSGECEQALLFCGTGVGISIAANKFHGIRACCCSDYFSARFTRLHNDANVLCLGGRVVDEQKAQEMVEIFLTTAFEGGRHAQRVAKITMIEECAS